MTMVVFNLFQISLDKPNFLTKSERKTYLHCQRNPSGQSPRACVYGGHKGWGWGWGETLDGVFPC